MNFMSKGPLAITLFSASICLPSPHVLSEQALLPPLADKSTESTAKTKVSKIVVIAHPIFDLSDPDSFFIHRWANQLHINSRESTIKHKLTFIEGDSLTEKEIEEAQRLLRYESFIRDASISVAQKDPSSDTKDNDTLVVETWDNWSLLPTMNLSQNGGDTRYSFGIKEDNLLGYGIKTRMSYQSNEDRSGYKFAFEAPFNLIKHATIGAEFSDNSDGQTTYLLFDKPFYELSSQYRYGAEYLDDLRIDTLRQNGVDTGEFEHEVNYANLSFGVLINKQSDHLSRFTLGVTQDKHQFSPSVDSQFPSTPLPKDRDFLYPWIGYEYLQDDFTVLNNVYLINKNEDFNLGWHHKVRLGFEVNDVDGSELGYHLLASSSRGYRAGDHLLLLSIDGKGTWATNQADFFNLGLQAEYFYQFDPKWTGYVKARIATSKNNYIDMPFALGDETGVRGYANDYQHGDDQWSATTEVRYYPNINLYQLAELGWAAFVDVGQASGGKDLNNEAKGVIGSVGIGARIYSSKSSYGNVAHIDLTVPFTDGQEVNAWEWRLQVKSHF
jgi:outer membrane protein assembly factor BamA